MNSCYNNISSYSATIDVKPANINSLPENLKTIFKAKAYKYNLDWKWLAAISWVESKWSTNAVNDGTGVGMTKKEAQKNAAKDALEKMALL